jgi:hypothetical protein
MPAPREDLDAAVYILADHLFQFEEFIEDVAAYCLPVIVAIVVQWKLLRN